MGGPLGTFSAYLLSRMNVGTKRKCFSDVIAVCKIVSSRNVWQTIKG